MDIWLVQALAYALILLRKGGLPCVFYGDYYGIPSQNVCAKKEMLDNMMQIRKQYAYGEQIRLF